MIVPETQSISCLTADRWGYGIDYNKGMSDRHYWWIMIKMEVQPYHFSNRYEIMYTLNHFIFYSHENNNLLWVIR